MVILFPFLLQKSVKIEFNFLFVLLSGVVANFVFSVLTIDDIWYSSPNVTFFFKLNCFRDSCHALNFSVSKNSLTVDISILCDKKKDFSDFCNSYICFCSP